MNKAALKRARENSLARLPGNPRTKSTVGTNPAMRTDGPSHPMAAGVVKRTRCAPMTAAQRDSTGRLSDWSRSVDFFTDPKWGKTLTDGLNP